MIWSYALVVSTLFAPANPRFLAGYLNIANSMGGYGVGGAMWAVAPPLAGQEVDRAKAIASTRRASPPSPLYGRRISLYPQFCSAGAWNSTDSNQIAVFQVD